MVDLAHNPYRSDRVATQLFYGRESIIDDLRSTFMAGRSAIRTVMGGRGIGKSSLALRLANVAGVTVKFIVASGSVHTIWREIGQGLGASLDLEDPVRALTGAIVAQPEARVALVLDEIERVLADPQGRDLLDNLLKVYERSDDRLGVLVLGGTGVRDLLRDSASPFLRMTGEVRHLAGLTRDETARLLREPLSLGVPDDVVEALWTETAGHPLLLQMFMETAVDLGRTSSRAVIDCIPEAMRDVTERRLVKTIFPIWWENLRERGQRCFRTLARVTSPLPRARWVATFGDDPRPWLDVLESTGIAHLDGHAVLPRGQAFIEWATENHPALPAAQPPVWQEALDACLTSAGAGDFERLVVGALAQWTRTTIEFPAVVLQPAVRSVTGNALLQSRGVLPNQCDHRAPPTPGAPPRRTRAALCIPEGPHRHQGARPSRPHAPSLHRVQDLRAQPQDRGATSYWLQHPRRHLRGGRDGRSGCRSI